MQQEIYRKKEDSSKPPTADELRAIARWESGEDRALNIIYAKVNNTLTNQLTNYNSLAAWEYLRNQFELTDQVTVQGIIASLLSAKSHTGNDVGKLLDIRKEILASSWAINFTLSREVPDISSSTEYLCADQRQLNLIYSEFIFSALPSSTLWQSWITAYRQAENLEFNPLHVIAAVRNEHNRECSVSTSSSDSPSSLILGNSSSSSSSALITTLKSSANSTSSKKTTRPKCKHCQKIAPNHDPEKCWLNVSNAKNKLGSGGSSSGVGGKKDKVEAGRMEARAEDREGRRRSTIPLPPLKCHVVADWSRFTEYKLLPRSLITVNGSQQFIVGVRSVPIVSLTPSGAKTVLLEDVLHVPSSTFNLISTGRFLDADFTLEASKSGYRILATSSRSVVLSAVSGAQRSPQVSLEDPVAAIISSSVNSRVEAVSLAHLRFGQPGKGALRDLLRLGAVKGLTTTDINKFFEKSCAACRLGKTTRLPFPISEKHASKPLERLHCDLAGPFHFKSWGDAKYFVIFVDEASGWVDGEPDSRVPVSSTTILQTDNGTEYTSKAFESMLANENITHSYSVPYTPQQNGRSERFVRTVKDCVTALLASANLSQKYWVEVFFFALFLTQDLPYSPNRGETPYHFLFGQHSPFFSLSKALVLGQDVWIHDPDAPTFGNKAVQGIFLGVGEGRGRKAYHVQEKGAPETNLRWAKDVSVAKRVSEELGSRDIQDDDYIWEDEDLAEEKQASELLSKKERSGTYSSSPIYAPGAISPSGGPQLLRLSLPPLFPVLTRIWDGEEPYPYLSERSRAERLGSLSPSLDTSDLNVVGVVLITVTFEPDVGDHYALFYLPGFASSDTALANVKKTFSIGNCPPPRTPRNSKEALSSIYSDEWRAGFVEEWDAFKKQGAREAELKSRLVVQGCKTIPFLSTFGPTLTPLPKWDPVPLFLILASRYRLPVWLTNFAKAYLGANVQTSGEPVFIEPPPHLEVKGRENKKFEEFGLVAVSDEATLYLGRIGANFVLYLVYDDNGMIAGKGSIVAHVLSQVDEESDITFQGPLNLGREIEYDHLSGKVVVRVENHIKKALKLHNFEDVKPLHLPIQPDIKSVAHEGQPIGTSEYLSAVGSLLFIATTRPNIQYAVGVASRFSSNPGPHHWNLVKRIFSYLSVTSSVGLSLGVNMKKEEGLVAFVDSDVAGNLPSRKSISGIILTLDGSPLSTISRLQSSVTRSTFQAELLAMSTGLVELKWYSSFSPLFPLVTTPLSPSAPTISPGLILSIKRGFVNAKWIPSVENPADLLTKALPAKRAKELGSMIGLVGWPDAAGGWGSC
ncbi:hypothetical protein JCM11641_003482 [Rhodosporidiobolus odoratus]